MHRFRVFAFLVAILSTTVVSCDCGKRSSRQADAAAPALATDAENQRDVVMVMTTTATMPPGFLKGQLHAHSSGSEDSNTSPSDVHRWYEQRGYDFIVFTDHNVITDTHDSEKTLTFAGVELTRNLYTCEPPPPQGMSCSLHMNALFVAASAATAAAADAGNKIDFGDLKSSARRDVYLYELRRVKALGGIAMLNHPNMLWGVSDKGTTNANALVIELARQGLTLLEIGNQAWDANNAGDAEHASTEAIWDSVLERGLHVFGTATDDAHHYDDAAAMSKGGERPFVGDLGFIVVRAAKNATTIRAAIASGDFYASTGLVLDKYEIEPGQPGAISIATRDGVQVLFEVIGRGGKVQRRERAASIEARLGPDDGSYLRVRATRDDGAMAWTQPVFRR